MRDKIHKIIMEYMSDGEEFTPTDKMLLAINKRICALIDADCISRQDAIDAIIADKIEDGLPVITDTQERDFEVFNSSCDRHAKILKELSSAEPEITLESAIDYLNSIGWLSEHDRIITESARRKSAERKGEWRNKPNTYGVAYCSECDFELHINDTNYCPNCGARMV